MGRGVSYEDEEMRLMSLFICICIVGNGRGVGGRGSLGVVISRLVRELGGGWASSGYRSGVGRFLDTINASSIATV